MTPGEIVHLVEKNERPMTVPEIAHRLGMPHSTLQGDITLLTRVGKVKALTLEQILWHGK